MNQDHLMQPGLKDQQDWIVWYTMRFGGAGAINFLNLWLIQRICMFVVLVTYFVIITRFLINNDMKNQMI